MSDAHKLRAQADKAAEADRIVNNPLVEEAFNAIEEQIETAWKRSGAEDHDIRERAYLMHRLLGNFRQFFVSAIANGDMARKELELIIKED